MLSLINKALRPLRKQLRLQVSRVTLNRTDEKGLLVNQVEALEGETLENVERLENYGLAGRPPAGSEGVMLAVGGSRDHPVLAGLEHRGHRPELAEGEVKLYAIFKQFIHLDKDGNIVFKAPKGFIFEGEAFKATVSQGFDLQGGDFKAAMSGGIAMSGERLAIAAPGGSKIEGGLSATQDITSEGEIKDGRGTMQDMRGVYNSHTHPETQSVTGPPSGKM